MQKIENISLAFCCREKLDKKLNCKTCSNTITDFRGLDASLLRNQLANTGKPVCGIFNTSQLSQDFVRYSLAAVFAASSLSLNSCSEEMSEEQRQVTPAGEIEVEVPLTGVVIETMAEPIGGIQKFHQSIQSQINFPPGLSEKGRCFVELVINVHGQIDDVKLIKGFDPLADQEAVRVIASLKIPFKPAEQGGVTVESKWIVPVVFDRLHERD